MADLTAMLQAAAGNVGGDYQIERSLRFNSADSAYLSRTPASAGNRRTFTISFWVKRSALGATQYITEGGSPDGATTRFMVRFLSTDKLSIANGTSTFFSSDAVYRDVSAWYHIVVAFDTPNATEANRYKIYVNGSQITGTDNYPSINADTGWNMAQAHSIGRSHIDAGSYFNGYITEFYAIDGQALTPSSFGEVDSVTGVWKPKEYTGTYGTNGFHLDFSDNSSTTALGYDAAGSNDWTVNNFSVTAGAGNDSLVDSPTQYGTDTGAGGEVRGNYCTLNPLAIDTANRTYTNGNLDVSISANNINVFGSMQISTTGKWYWEYQITTIGGGSAPMGGVAAGFITDLSNAVVYRSSGNKIVNGTESAYGATYTTTDIIGVAVDVDGGTVTFYKNGSSQGAITFAAGNLFPVLRSNAATDVFVANFGQRPFAYTAPSGFKALCTTNLPDPTVVQGDDYFNTVLYTGTGSSLGVTGVGFQPDFVWIKERSGAADHALYDAVRGVQNQLESNTTTAETAEATGLTAFGSDGFTVGALAQLNTSADTYVAWNWKANGAGVSNTDGTITSTVSANTTAGISIVTYTGNGNANATVGHGLGVIPAMIICKSRSTTTAWYVKHTSLASNNNLLLAGTDAQYNVVTGSGNGGLGNLSSSTTFGFLSGTSSADATNLNGGTFVAYCFAPVSGFSAFGSYTGNGSTDGTFVYLGFRPAFIMIKQTSSSGNPWVIQDSGRSLFNLTGLSLYPNSNAAEESAAIGASGFDFLSNGFKNRSSGSVQNASGATYIYMAFSEVGFKYALGR